MKKTIYLLIMLTLLINSSCSQSKQFNYGTVKNNVYLNNFLGLEIPFNSDWAASQKNHVSFNINKEIIENKINIKRKDLGRATLFSLVKDSTNISPTLIVEIINKRFFPKFNTIENYFDKIYTKDKDLFKNNESIEKNIGSLEFTGIRSDLGYDFQEVKFKNETFAVIKSEFILSFNLVYSNEKEKKELYEIIDKIKI